MGVTKRIKKVYKPLKRIPKKRLAGVVSKLTRTLFRGRCFGVCSHYKRYDFNELEGAHFCVRKHQSTSYLLSNVLPACSNCNRFVPEHVDQLGKNIDLLFGEGTSDKMIMLSKRNCKLSPYTRYEMATFLKRMQKRAEKIIAKEPALGKKEVNLRLKKLAIRINTSLINKFIIPNII